MKKNDREKTKGEHLSIRIRSQSKFALEYWAPTQFMRSETAMVEAALHHYARRLALPADVLAELEAAEKRILRAHKDPPAQALLTKLFHSHRGVRMLRLWTIDDFPVDDDQARQREFAWEHRPFFFEAGADGASEVIVPNVVTLWDKKAGLTKWMKLGEKDYYEPGRAMAAALRARGLEAPEWPPRRAKR